MAGARRRNFAVLAPDGTPYEVSKLHAFAIISGHPRCSKDRSLRVQTMSRFVSLPTRTAADAGHALSATPDV